MKKFFLLCLFFLLSHSASFAKSFEFAIISDPHLISSRNPISFTQSEKNVIFAVDSINKNKNIEFVVFLGDSIDNSKLEDLQSFMNIVQNLNKPYYIVCGNHDAYSAGGISKEDFIKFIHEYNPKQDRKDTSFYFKASKDAFGLILDGSSWVVPSQHGRYLPEQLSEAEKFLNFKKNDMILIFQHFPLIHPDDNESHYTLDTEPYLALIERFPNIVLIASGHFHRQKFIFDRNGIYHISAPALGSRASSNGSGYYEIVKVQYDKSLFSKPHNITVDVKNIAL